MAQPYYDQLKDLVKKFDLENVECRHFFSGAASWVNGEMFISFWIGGMV